MLSIAQFALQLMMSFLLLLVIFVVLIGGLTLSFYLLQPLKRLTMSLITRSKSIKLSRVQAGIILMFVLASLGVFLLLYRDRNQNRFFDGPLPISTPDAFAIDVLHKACLVDTKTDHTHCDNIGYLKLHYQ